MYRPLVPCPSCDRHVLASETTCPFCASVLPADLASSVMPAAPARLNRAAAFVFGATVAVASCSADVTDSSSSTSGSGGAGGESAVDAGKDGPDDDGGSVALYGDPPPPPPMDGGGGGVPLYGAPPPPGDAG